MITATHFATLNFNLIYSNFSARISNILSVHINYGKKTLSHHSAYAKTPLHTQQYTTPIPDLAIYLTHKFKTFLLKILPFGTP